MAKLMLMRVCVLLVTLLLAPAFLTSNAAPMSPTDLFSPPCPGGFLVEPAITSFKLWSNPATWPSGAVPGVGTTAGANVTIPCGSAVLLDVAAVKLTVLHIRGLLRVVDSAALPDVQVQASFIIVEGQLYAGTAAQHFSRQLTFTLLPNPNNRAAYNFCVDFPGTCNAPADPANPRNLGHKTFAVVGGQVRLFGMPGGSSTIAYTKLIKMGNVGDLVVYVDKDVSSWPVGTDIVIASTDYLPDQAEAFKIAGLTVTSGTTKIYLSKGLKYNHFGDPFGVPDGFGGYVDQRAEVASLYRNIVITGLDEPIPLNYEGGHFMIFHTPAAQAIEGVRFWRMGQQGTLGRYSIHFHISGSHTNTILRKNVIHDSKQRCVVIHATFNLTVDTNVAYNTSGHCYLTEEGGEVNNTFIRNLGIRTRASDRIIPPSTSVFGTVAESDGSPATFWLTNPTNNYIDNIAAGSDNSGYWLELRGNVRGNTVTFAPYNLTVPNMAPLGVFTNNVAHSNRGPGLRFYPSGYRPRVGAYVGGPTWSAPTGKAILTGLTSWKHGGDGVFVHGSDNIVLIDGVFADNRYGVNINANSDVWIKNSRFVGQTTNYGTPMACDYHASQCGPIAPSCVFPIPAGQSGRSMGWNNWKNPIVGIIIDHSSVNSGDYNPHLFDGNKFSAYDATCRPAAAYSMGLNAAPKTYWGAEDSFSGTKLTANSNAIFFPSSNFTLGDGGIFLAGEIAKLYVYYDRDGSVTGGTYGFAVANNPAILPPLKRYTCTFQPKWPGYACPNVCYRTVMVSYVEDGFYPNSTTNQFKDYSYLMVRRLEDNVILQLEGNLRMDETAANAPNRYFVFSVVAGTTYEINIGLGKNARFVPTNITLKYRDSGSCGVGVTFRVMGKYSWLVPDHSNTVGWTPCAGSTAGTALQYSYVCHKQKSTLQVRMGGNYTGTVIFLRSRFTTPPCQLSYQCGLIPSNYFWSYDVSNAELHPVSPGSPAFFNPKYDVSKWPVGRAPFGYSSWNWNVIVTPVRKANQTSITTYYRRDFSIINSACVTGIYVDLLYHDAAVIYLNNVELFRTNLPNGNVTASTSATLDFSVNGRLYITFFIPINSSAPFSLVDGTNYISAEIHVCGWGCTEYLFDMRVWAQASAAGCRGPATSVEVCDGLDNDADGTVDIDPATSATLKRPCSTSCGTGFETCVNGAYQGCTATKSFPEICNGKDDDCDGMVDNGPGQLDCAQGLVCYAGKCLQKLPLTSPTTTVPRNSSGWYYIDTGDNVPQTYPNWTVSTDLPLAQNILVKKGSTTFGFDPNGVAVFGTKVDPLDSMAITYYFLYPFSLTAAEVNATQSFSMNVRRDDGAIVYINGLEVFRTNMPDGPVVSTTLAKDSWNQKMTYFPNIPFRNTSSSLKAGLNWLAVEVHQSGVWGNRDFVFDMDLIRNTFTSCSSLPGAPASCVRFPPADNIILSSGSTWSYLDASYPLPPYSWTSPSFDDSAWPVGVAPLGLTTSWNVVKTFIQSGVAQNNSRITYYFRKKVTVPDGGCHFNITIGLLVMDGAVVYINGAEAYRYQMPTAAVFPNTIAPIFPTTLATTNWFNGQFQSGNIAGGYIKTGVNTIAVEVHHSTWVGNAAFDIKITGQREGVDCPVLPV